MRRTNRDLLDSWIQKNGPGGLEKLAVASGVSVSLLSRIRSYGGSLAPARDYTRQKICSVLGVKDDDLFPPGKRSRAS